MSLLSRYHQRVSELSPAQQTRLRNLLTDGSGRPQSEQPNALIAFVTCNDTHATDISKLRTHLSQHLPNHMIPAQIIPIEVLPTLANGKIDNNALTTLYHKDAITTDTLTNDTERNSDNSDAELRLIDVWSRVLQTDLITADDNFFEIGGDSILSIQVVSLANQSGFKLSPNDLFSYPTIRQLVAQQTLNKAGVDTPQTDIIDAPLTPIQNWYFSQNLTRDEHWNQNGFLAIHTQLSNEMLQNAIDAVMKHHAALRTCFNVVSEKYTQHLTEFERTTIEHLDQVDLDEINRFQSGFDLLSGPLIRWGLIPASSTEPMRLLICTHHLIIDAVSWTILLQDLETACRLAQLGQEINLPKVTLSPLQWSTQLAGYAQTDVPKQELEYWKNLPLAGNITIPRATCPDDPTERNSETLVISLASEQTLDLQTRAHDSYNTSIIELLLSALAQTLGEWTSRDINVIGLEGHGREAFSDNIDTFRSIGWLTSYYPVCLSIVSSDSIGANLKSTREMISHIPANGFNYGVLKYLCDDSDIRRILQDQLQPEFLFNYLGDIDKATTQSAMFSQLDVSSFQQRAPDNTRSSLIDLNCHITSGQLHMAWTFDRIIHTQREIEKLSEHYRDCLLALIEHCIDPQSQGYTPSDFPDAELDQNDLDAFLDRIS